MIGTYPAMVLDVEVYPNFTLLGFREIDSGAVRHFSNVAGIGEPMPAFRQWFLSEQHQWLWLTFNGMGYDNHILRAVLHSNDNVFDLSVGLINRKDDWRDRLESAMEEVSCDIYAIHNSSRIGKLKVCGVLLNYPRLRELPYPFDAVLTEAQMREVAEYNTVDLEVTSHVAQAVAGKIAMRLALSMELGVNVINKHDAALAEAVMAHRLFADGRRIYPTATAWHLTGEELVAKFHYTDPALQDLRERIRQWDMRPHIVSSVKDGEIVKSVEGNAFSESVKVGEVSYSIGVGGLHSVDEPAVFEADDRYCLLDLDAASFYPSIILNHAIAPGHLPKTLFLREFAALRERRLNAKDQGHRPLADGLKVAVNSLFGKTGSAYGYLTDPAALIRCTVTGQLTLLQFVDALSAIEGVAVVSLNTDGMTLKVPRALADDLKRAVTDFAADLNLTLDWAEYRLLARRDVNNYIAIGVDGRMKARGAYAYDDANLEKRPVNRIAIDAAQEYFQHGIPVSDTVRACRDITKFIDYFKCNKGYRIVGADGSEYGSIARWYLSPKGQHLDKLAQDGKRTQLVEAGAVVANDLPETFPADLDYDAYVARADKLVKDITEPEVKHSTTIPLADLSKPQRQRLLDNYAAVDADLARCQQIDLERCHADWAARVSGNRRDTMRTLLVRLWLAGNGTLTRGDLLWCAVQLDAADGYFNGSMQRNLKRMVEWICRDISPFKLPQTVEEQVRRAMDWAAEHVERLQRKRKMHHRGVLNSTYVSGKALRDYGKTKDDYKLACSICAVTVKHASELSVAEATAMIEEVHAFDHTFKENTHHEVV